MMTSLSPLMANGQCRGAGEHHVMHGALLTRLDEGLQADQVVLGGQCREQEVVCTQGPDLVRGQRELTSKCSSGLSG